MRHTKKLLRHPPLEGISYFDNFSLKEIKSAPDTGERANDAVGVHLEPNHLIDIESMGLLLTLIPTRSLKQRGFMMKRLMFLCVAVAMTQSAVVHAQDAYQQGGGAGQPPALSPQGIGDSGQFAGRRGLDLSLGFGVDGCTDKLCEDYSPMVYLRMQGMFRLLKHFAVGLHMAFLFSSPDIELKDGASLILWDLFIGPEVRGHFPIKNLDLWGAMMLGYQRHQLDASYEGNSASSWADGFGLGWGFGARYFLFRSFAIGGDFWIYKPIYSSWCSSSTGKDTDCKDIDDQDGVGINWSFGATATFFLPL